MGLKNFFDFAAIATITFAFVACGSNQEKPKAEETTPAANEQTTVTENAAQVAESADFKTITLTSGATVTWIKDNADNKLNPRSLFNDATDEQYASINMPEGIPASMSVFLLKVDGEYVLFDAGLGDFGGQMMARFAKLNINVDDIKFIYLTHLHVDHISGLVKKTDTGFEKIFRNAAIYLSKAEHDGWMNDIEKNDLQKAILGIYSDSLHLFTFGDKLPHDVEVIDAVGHTPGHAAFRYNELLVVGDLMHGYALQIKYPEINSNYDQDKAKSIESRKRLLEYAKTNKLIMAGMHFAAPGFTE